MKTFTFYSYKGGTGRSLLLANAARYLAFLGERVVSVDFDFEAPDLHYKLNISPPGKRTADVIPERGVVDYLLAAACGDRPPKRLLDYVVSVPLPQGRRTFSTRPGPPDPRWAGAGARRRNRDPHPLANGPRPVRA